MGRGQRAYIALLVSALLLYSLSGCSALVFVPPNPMVLKSPPVLAEPEQFYQDYTSSYSTTTASKYDGQRVLFPGLTVAKVFLTSTSTPQRTDFFTVGYLLFKPRYPADLLTLTEGTIVDVAGEPVGMSAGMSGSYIIVVECWVRVLGGAIPNYPRY